jgi:hypothetical protein
MTEQVQSGPWNDYPAPTATPPMVSTETKPWEDYGPSPNTPTGFPEPQAVDNPPAGAEKPFEQRLAENIQTVGSGMATGMLAGSVVGGIGGKVASLFETPESLKSAGINATTLEHMAPGGQAPGDWANAVEKQFQAKGVLAKTANDTWKLMYPEAQKVGQAARDAFDAVKEAGGPDAVMIDANKALDPIANEALKRGTGLFSKTENLANPFYQAYDGLQDIAKGQGGKLSVDNIDSALQETGTMMNEGGEAVQGTYSKLYGKLADARDIIVNNVANQVRDQGLKQALLQNNADYSTYMRVLPSIEKAGYREAIKEGVSAYAKHIGPLGEKLMAAGGMYAATRAIMDKVLGNH